MIDPDYFLELEDARFRMKLIQHRLVANMTTEDVAEIAERDHEWVIDVEDLDSDPTLSSIRRYAHAVGAVIRHRTVVSPDFVPKESSPDAADSPPRQR